MARDQRQPVTMLSASHPCPTAFPLRLPLARPPARRRSADSHDTDRFLSLRNSLPAFRNALAHVLLSEGIPSMCARARSAKSYDASHPHPCPAAWLAEC